MKDFLLNIKSVGLNLKYLAVSTAFVSFDTSVNTILFVIKRAGISESTVSFK